MDPSPGNIAPSWPVAIAHGIRNTTNPMIHQPNADGPADWITAALVMNSTIATKIATMSNVVSTLGRIPPATRSEISRSELGEVLEALLGDVHICERGYLGALHRQVRPAAQVAEGVHQQGVCLQG